MTIMLDEQETTISFCRVEDEASVWTSDKTMFTKFDKLCSQVPDFYECREVARDKDGDIISKTYRIRDKRLLSFRTVITKQNLTAEQKAARAERLKQATEGRIS